MGWGFNMNASIHRTTEHMAIHSCSQPSYPPPNMTMQSPEAFCAQITLQVLPLPPQGKTCNNDASFWTTRGGKRQTSFELNIKVAIVRCAFIGIGSQNLWYVFSPSFSLIRLPSTAAAGSQDGAPERRRGVCAPQGGGAGGEGRSGGGGHVQPPGAAAEGGGGTGRLLRWHWTTSINVVFNINLILFAQSVWCGETGSLPYPFVRNTIASSHRW